MHIQNQCRKNPSITREDEEKLMNLSVSSSSSNLNNSTFTNKVSLDEKQIDKHVSNLYLRIHTLETELFKLKKIQYIGLFVLSTIAMLIYFGSIFLNEIILFLSVFFKQCLPTLIKILATFLFNFSPLITLLRIIIIIPFFFFACYKSRLSHASLSITIICIIIVLFNLLILILHLIITHIVLVFFTFIMIIIGKYFRTIINHVK